MTWLHPAGAEGQLFTCQLALGVVISIVFTAVVEPVLFTVKFSTVPVLSPRY
jgi:hypothetical protein